MKRTAIIVALGTAIACGVLVLPVAAKTEAGRKPTVEQTLDVGWARNAKIIVLPTGERVLLITGSDGLATCCLLPPLAPPQVEKTP